jgi:hypothetical protein
MISIQRLTGRPKEFFGLLEESALLGAEAARALRQLVLRPGGGPPDLAPIIKARRQDKDVYLRLDALLTRVFATPIEREDIAEIGQQLYRLPKTIEKFAERYEIVHEMVDSNDMVLAMGMLERAADIVVRMVQTLAKSKTPLVEIKAMEARLSQLDDEAGHVLLNAERILYQTSTPALSAIVTKELYDVLGECLTVCGDIGGALALAVLRNS